MKKRYLNVSNRLAKSILWNTIFDSLVSANLGGLIVSDNVYVKWGLGLFGILCVVLRRVTQKQVDFNTPGKKQILDSTLEPEK